MPRIIDSPGDAVAVMKLRRHWTVEYLLKGLSLVNLILGKLLFCGLQKRRED